jgi:hypothetical protein
MRKRTLPLAFLFLLTCIASCNNGKLTIVGKWKPIKMDSKNREFNEKSEADKKKELEGASVEFTATGKFIAVSPGHAATNGTYTYDEKAGIINTVSKERNETVTIVSLEKNKMVVKSEDDMITLVRE